MSMPLRSGLWGGSPVLSVILVMLASVLLGVDGVFANQLIAPVNTSSATARFELGLLLPPPKTYQVPLNPLTLEAGQQIVSPLGGTLVLTTNSTVAALGGEKIAYICCDPSSGDNPDDTFRAAVDRNPEAIVLYSRTSSSCMFKGSPQYNILFSVTAANNSLAVEAMLTQAQSIQAEISLGSGATTSAQSFPTGSSGNNSGGGSSSGLGASPTTTVAMIILYSITGLVTALFLIIIATGAIRAHRHPERYGPRLTGTLGRQRQSRAKGLARAVLESIPIVKFGEKDDDKPPGGDVELGAANRQRPSATGGDGAVDATREGTRPSEPEDRAEGGEQHHSSSAQASEDDAAITPAELPPAAAAAAGGDSSGEEIQPSTEKAPESKDEGLSCSICTEDFVKGENIRVLPCNHKYHPDCVDPWLLNVSGTCPLCRIDLTHTTAHDNALPHTTRDNDISNPNRDTHPSSTNPNSLLPPPLPLPPSTQPAQTDDTIATPSRRSRYLDLRRLAHANPEERISILRRLRETNQQEQDQRRAGRLSGVFRVFGIRSGRSGTQEDGGGPSGAEEGEGDRALEREGGEAGGSQR